MISETFAFAAGVILLQRQVSLPAALWPLLIPAVLFVFWRYPSLRLPAAFGFGFLWALLHAHWVAGGFLPPELEGKEVTVEGRVVSLPETGRGRVRFEFQVDRLSYQGKRYPSPGRIRLGWYRESPVLVPGETWQLRVRLKAPHGFSNPGGFDYEGWLFRNGIRATGYVRESRDNRKTLDSSAGYALQRLRQQIRETIESKVEDPTAAGLLKALVIGDRSGLSRADWELFRQTGTNHLIAISGLHIGIVSGLAFFLSRRLWAGSERLTLMFSAPRAAAICALLAAAVYAALAGFSVPTRRAMIMLAVFMAGLLTQRTSKPARSISIALFVLLLIDPFAILSPGFWFSFLAVAVILLGLSARVRRSNGVRSWFRVQWLVAMGMAPMLLAWMLPVPLLAPLINLLAVPVFSLLVIPLALIGSCLSLISDPLGGPLLNLGGWLLSSGRDLLAHLAEIPLRVPPPGNLPGYLWGAIATGALLLLAPRGLPGRWLGGILLIPLCLPSFQGPRPGEVWFDLLDVGQGLSVVLRTQRHLLVYDTGPRFSDRFDAGAAVLVPFLESQGIKRVDKVIISNGDEDHRGGLSSLLHRFSVDEVLSGEPERVTAYPAQPCIAGAEWYWDEVRFRILHPIDPGKWKGNDASCVLQVENQAGRILIPGDIEAAAENALLGLGTEQLQSDLVVIPHHGSRTSSSSPFVRATRPDYALASAGYLNRHRFPKAKVVSRWQAAGARVIDTASSGDIHFRFGMEEGITAPVLYRTKAARYWTHRLAVNSSEKALVDDR